MLPPADKKSLEQLFILFKELELNSQDGNFPVLALEKIKQCLRSYRTSLAPELQKLALIENHLHPQMTVKHFVAFLVPIERLLQKNVQDDDFLISTTDKNQLTTPTLPLVFVLDNIRSAFNVGSILRTAECLHIEKVYLCGYTPLPTQSKLAKTAMGTEDLVHWEHRQDIRSLLQELQFKAYHVVALETAEKAQSIHAPFPFAPTALVVGNERFGLGTEVLQNCAEVREIPLRGRKNSLNVGTSLAVAAFEWNRQYGK